MILPAVPEPVHDAALRVLGRDARPDDADLMRRWFEAQAGRLSARDLALEVMRHGYECGVEGRTA